MTDAEAFEAFVRRYQDMVFATAVRLLGRPAEAEDVSQTVFLRAFQRFADLERSPAAAGWLRTVTRNACLNHLSRYRARWTPFSEISSSRSGGGGPDAASIEDVPAGTSLEYDLEQADRLAQLEQALGRLPDHQRVPLVLYHFEGVSYRDIASTLGVSLGKVKTDIHRGREALRRALSEDHAAK